MEIDSEKYYGILLCQEYHDAGEDFLEAMSADLRLLGNEEDTEDVVGIGLSPYRLDVRCLIGFALAHTDYHFSVGGLSHVIGHQVRPFYQLSLDTLIHFSMKPARKSQICCMPYWRHHEKNRS